jgi:hypothetical protein
MISIAGMMKAPSPEGGVLPLSPKEGFRLELLSEDSLLIQFYFLIREIIILITKTPALHPLGDGGF